MAASLRTLNQPLERRSQGLRDSAGRSHTLDPASLVIMLFWLHAAISLANCVWFVFSLSLSRDKSAFTCHSGSDLFALFVETMYVLHTAVVHTDIISTNGEGD